MRLHTSAIQSDTVDYLECPSACYYCCSISVPIDIDYATLYNTLRECNPGFAIVGVSMHENGVTLFRIPETVSHCLREQGVLHFVPYTSCTWKDSTEFVVKTGHGDAEHMCVVPITLPV